MWIPFSLTRLDSTQLNLPHLTSYHPALPCLTFVLTRNGSFHLTSPHLTSPYLTLPYLTLPYRTLPYLTVPQCTLPHLTFSFVRSTNPKKKYI
ncbi:hypothetical protein F4703DRAFT_1209031 [Phycomyces blakesleeanus]